MRKPKRYNAKKEVRALARERVGTVPSPQSDGSKELKEKAEA